MVNLESSQDNCALSRLFAPDSQLRFFLIKSHQAKWWSLVALLSIVHHSETLTSSWTFYRDITFRHESNQQFVPSTKRAKATACQLDLSSKREDLVFLTPSEHRPNVGVFLTTFSPSRKACRLMSYLARLPTFFLRCWYWTLPISRCVVPDSSIISTLERNFALVLVNLIHPDRSLSLKLRQ